jgi:integrase
MSKVHSTTSVPTDKPQKPYPEFPLFPHATRRWAKKIRGQLHYFGPWDDPEGALAKYEEQKEALHAGRKPRAPTAALTIKDLANAYLDHKQELVDAGELSPRSWADYKECCDLLVDHLGKGRIVEDVGPEDFAALRGKLTKKWGPTRVGNVIQRVRGVFKFAADNGLIQRTIVYGQGFKRPSRKTIRLHRAKKGPKLFSREEILSLLLFAPVHLESMLLLAINCGFGNADCGQLPLSVLNLDTGWIDFPRPKTGIPRKCKLWPETVAALREALAERPQPKDPEHAGLVFITKYGKPWAKDTPDGPICKEMAKLLKALGINGREGLGFYTLRHTFRTVADECKDQPAVDFTMGHEVPHMSAVYRETISDARLKAVTDYVHAWLFPPAPAMPTLNASVQ